MTEIATLGLRVDGTANIDSATTSLDRFSKSGRDAETAAGSLSKGSKTSSKSLAEVARQSDRASQGVGNLARVARSAASLIVAAVGGMSFGRVVSETARFEDALLGLQAVSGATAEQMEALEKQARVLGATSMFSAQQAGDAQRFLAQAGFEVNEILSATPGLLDLATAGQMDLARAADIASNVLGGMRLEVAELGRVNDVLAATAAGANTSIEQLGQALSFAAPFAAAAGISIEDTAAAIGAMSDAGIQASRAGTGLVGIIRQLSRITPAAARALEAAGIAVEDVNIESNGLHSVLDTLSRAGLDTGQAIEIFGSEAGAAALNVINASDGVAEFARRLEDSDGAAKAMAQTIGSGLTGSMRSFTSMLSESVISLGRDQGVAGGFQAVIDTASGVLAVYNDMLTEFAEANNLTDAQARNLNTLANVLGAVTTVAGGAVAAIVAYQGTVVAATAAQALFNAAVTANPLGLIVTAAGAAVGALYYYREELGLVDIAAQNATNAIAANAGAIRSGSQAALDSSYETLVNSLEAVSLQAQEAMAQLVELEARQRFYESSHKGVADSVTGAISQQNAALAELWERQVTLQRAMRENRSERERLTGTESDAVDVGEVLVRVTSDLNSETDKLTKAQRDAIREAEQFAGAFRSLHDQLRPIEAAQRRYREEVDLLNAAHGRAKEMLDAKLITEEEYNSILRDRSFLLQELESRYRDSTQTPSSAYSGFGFGSQIGDPVGGMGVGHGQEDEGYWDRWLSSAETALTDFDQLAANTAENFQRGFGNAFEAMVFDSQSLGDAMYNLTEGMARSMVSALGEMAAQWLAYQAVQMMVGRTTQSSAASTMITNAMAQQQMAGLNAFSSIAAIPIVGPFMAPGAMAAAIAATSPSVAAISSLAVAGMAHDGIDSIPREGTWLLDRGERVLNAPQAARLDQFLDQNQRGGIHRGGGVTVNLIENPDRGGEVLEREGDNGERFIDIFVANIAQGGKASRAIESTYGLRRQGR